MTAADLRDPNPKRRLDAALALAREGDFSGLDEVLRCLTSEDREVRLKAAGICAQIGPSAALSALATMATADPASENRNQAIFALAAVGRPSVVPTLIEALDDPERERRQDARQALYDLLGRAILPLLNEEDGGDDPDPAEAPRVAAWWQAHAKDYDPERSYVAGKLASPSTLVEALGQARSPLPDAVLEALRNVTGQDFGNEPLPDVVAAWKAWVARHAGEYEPGRRYFHGQPVP